MAFGVAIPAAASADVLCVGSSGGDCQSAYPANGTGFQAALDAAGANAGRDTVRLVAGNYMGGFVSPASSEVEIVGAGNGTVLTRGPGPAPYEAILKVSDGRSSVERLAVAFPAIESAGMYGVQSNGLVADVSITGGGEMTRGIAANGATIRRARIDTPLNGYGAALLDSTLEDSIITGNGTGVYAAGRSVVRRSGLETRHGLMIFAGNPVTIDSTLIKVPAGVGGTGLQYDYSYGQSKVVARNVTMIGTGDPNSTGFVVGAYSANQYKALDISSSVMRGFDRVFSVEGLSGGAGARVDVRYSSFDPSKVRKAGFALIATGPGNLADPAPLFAPASFQPLAGSPLIDAGDPGVPPQPRSDTDLVGRPRVTGRARDIGAYELPDTVAPVVSKAKLSRKRFRVGSRGTRISYTLSEPARVLLRFDRKLKGRVVRTGKGRRCRRETRRNRKGRKRCTVQKTAGTLRRQSPAGPTVLRFSGRIGKKRLKPGRYLLDVGARDASGNISRSRNLHFTVVK
jgi:hypothetical protein